MSSVAFLGLQNAPRSLAAGVSPQTPLDSLQRFPDSLAGFNGAYFKASTFKGGREERDGRERAPK